MGIAGATVDGNDVLAVHDAAAALIREIRAGGGPRFLHALTYRFKGHVSVDPGTYRDAAEVEAALRDDPLLRARTELLTRGVAAGEVDAIDAAARDEIGAALAAAEAAPWPEASAAYEDVIDTGAGRWR
jgi:pyruvate dehydrogenase E1 component alpha subunit